MAATQQRWLEKPSRSVYAEPLTTERRTQH
jgi:hypothetical protein